jgi:transcriptional regulator with XRE-family HTH domain
MPRVRTATRDADVDAELAQRIGDRIRDTRRRAGMTQQQLAGERYTKAYISALENGVTRPSMVALTYIADRLSVPPSSFLGESHPVWSRLEVDMRLASGEWASAADGYESLLEGTLDVATRAEILRGLAEASARLDRGRAAVAAASESVRLFTSLGRRSDTALARYWLAYGMYLSDNETEARAMLGSLLEQVRSGLRVEADFEMRLLTAMAAIESRLGEPGRALAYLEEARGLSDDLDDRQRANYLFNLAISYREAGDVEAAIRAGQQGLALYRASGATFESATIENDLAMAYLATGNLERAAELATEAHEEFERAGDDRFLAAVLETEAQVALAGGDSDGALSLAARSRQLARSSGNRVVEVAALVTAGQAERRRGNTEAAAGAYLQAAEMARDGAAPARLREILGEWAELRADAGDFQGAYELTAEAARVK